MCANGVGWLGTEGQALPGVPRGRPGKDPAGTSDAASLLLPFAVCALLPPALPADGCLSPPGCAHTTPALAALLVPCRDPSPSLRHRAAARGWEREPALCPTAGRSRAAGATAQAPAPLGGLGGRLRALTCARTPRAGAGVCVRAGPVAAALTLALADCGFCLYAGGVR